MERALFLTGGRGAGKTTLCLALAALSPRFTGLVSPRLFGPTGGPVGFAARCIGTGEAWEFGRSDVDLDGPRYGRFSFSSAGIGRAVDCLREILLRSSHPAAPASRPLPPPIVIVDEIGPLELERGEGLAPILPLLAGAGDLLLVVRPSLVSRLEVFVPRHVREVLVVTPENRASLASVVASRFA